MQATDWRMRLGWRVPGPFLALLVIVVGFWGIAALAYSGLDETTVSPQDITAPAAPPDKQAPEVPREAGAPLTSDQIGVYLGSGYCALCHDNSRNRTELCLMTENTLWKQKDKHTTAFVELTKAEGQRMGQLLGWETAVHQDARCLSCHALATTTQPQNNFFDIKDGVTCEACHGPGGGWVNIHNQRGRWFPMSAENKRKLGYRETRDPVAKAALCASCHVGSVAEGKVISHEMFAVGHPPLPSIETAQFLYQQGQHWQVHADKPKSVHSHLGYVPGRMENTRQMVIGGVVNLRESLRLLADATRSAKTPVAAHAPWPDLGYFDCFACHQELHDQRGRRFAGGVLSLEQPTPRVWPTLLTKVALRQMGLSDNAANAAVREHLEPVWLAPWNQPRVVAAASQKAIAWCDKLLNDLKTPPMRFDKAAALQILRILCEIGQRDVFDFDAARQIGWALEVVHLDLEVLPRQDERFRRTLLATRKSFHFHLPCKKVLPKGEFERTVDDLPAALRARRDFDRAAFAEAMKTLQFLLDNE